MKPIATKEDWELRNKLAHDPNCIMEDEYGELAAPWQQALCRQLENLVNSCRWVPDSLIENGKKGLFDQFTNRILVPPEYDEIEDLPELGVFDMAFDQPIPVRRGNLWGVISSDGKNKIILPFEYQEIKYVEYDCLRVKEFGKYGLIYIPCLNNRTLDFPSIADWIEFDSAIGLFLFWRNEKCGIIGITDSIFDSFYLFDDEEESIVAVKEGKNGFLTKEGKFYAMDSVFLPCNDKRLHHWDISPTNFIHVNRLDK